MTKTRYTTWLSELSSKGLVRLPQLTGVLRTDNAALSQAGEDFGNLHRSQPAAVLEPGSDQDIINIMKFAREQGIRVVPRGQGHTAYGQSQVENGIVIKMTSFHSKIDIGPDWIKVSAGSTWRDVLSASLTHGLRPPVLTNNLFLTVGGTLSVGGVDGASYRFGAQVDHVLELEVVTGEGKLEVCSDVRLPELFEAVLSGQGQCAIILRAKLHIIPAVTHVLNFQLPYNDLQALLDDLRMLIADGRFDKVSIHIVPIHGGSWSYFIHASFDFTPPAALNWEHLLDGLHHHKGFEKIETLTYLASSDHGSKHFFELNSFGREKFSHPWFDMFIPNSTLDQYLEELFTALDPSGIASDFPMELCGFNTAACQ